MTRRPNGPWLIESSPDYTKRMACLFLQRMALLPVTILCAAIDGYRNEQRHMMAAAAIDLEDQTQQDLVRP